MPQDWPAVSVHAAQSAGGLVMADSGLTPADAAVVKDAHWEDNEE